jgi:predicted Zn-dependent protease
VEREADTIGWHYLMAADIDPRGLADFFQLETEGEAATTIPEMFRSHPATSERISSLNKLWEKSERKSGFVQLPAMTNAPLTDLQKRVLRLFNPSPK